MVRPSYVLGGRAMEIVYSRRLSCVTICATQCQVSRRFPGVAGLLPERRH
ncbi:MAG: hypothetical protein ACFHHU_14305 [Porticoccaceae bacterium]